MMRRTTNPDGSNNKPPLGKIGVAVGAVLAAFAALCSGVVQQQDQPLALATSIFPGGEKNLIIWKDRIEEQRITVDKSGHAEPPSWTGKIGPLPGGRIPAVKKMGWNPPYVAAVASGSRPLYYCLDEVRAYDRQHGTQITPLMEGGLKEMWDQLFEKVSSVEDCSRADFVMGANAEVDCGGPGAAGCAWFNGKYTRVTFNGALRASGGMDDNAIKYTILFHEGKHALDFDHTGNYGGEGQPHAHLSDMGFLGNGGYPVDNPTGRVAIEDYHAEGGAGLCCGLTLKGQEPKPPPGPPAPPPPPPAPPAPPPPLPSRATTHAAQSWEPSR
ncbi:MAG TPA: hypothetical protein VNM48_06440, partial [Chloroflexota bacterium]|nr:hypothetical protein [Chloroflexota bacterium]